MSSQQTNSSAFYPLAMAGLGGHLYGVDFGVIAAAEPYLKALGIYSGARVSLIVGAVLAVGLFAIGGMFLAIERLGVAAGNATGLVTLVLFFFMYCFYAIGPGICVWLVLSELMPKRIRANGMAIALFMNQLVACGLASTFRPWVENWGWYSMFFFFAVNAVVYFIVACFLPETKGKTLDELEHLFEKK